MVLGEPQILGQMKQAARIAFEANTMGSELRHWFEKSFAVAKDVRTNTAIGEHPYPWPLLRSNCLKRVFEDFHRLHVLLVGAGEMSGCRRRTHRRCATEKASPSPIARSSARRWLPPRTRRFNAQAIRLTELAEQLARFDAVVTCTASTLPIIGLGMVEIGDQSTPSPWSRGHGGSGCTARHRGSREPVGRLTSTPWMICPTSLHTTAHSALPHWPTRKKS